MWSPNWARCRDPDEPQAFDNTDFVDVVIHSYRHRTGNAAGDPRYASIEARLAAQPRIDVPTIVLHGAKDGVMPCRLSEAHGKYFAAQYQRRLLENVGHNPPQEAPHAFAEAILQLCEGISV